jgi:adenosylcobinamide-GDP ribazoletransferase
VSQVVSADIAAALAAFAVTRLGQRQIGGYTGDVLGAAQQAAEIAVLLALSAR